MTKPPKTKKRGTMEDIFGDQTPEAKAARRAKRDEEMAEMAARFGANGGMDVVAAFAKDLKKKK